MTAQELLDRLEGVRRVGEGWSARCPAHEDRNASLSIAEGAGGQLLAHCHAGCTFDQILGAVGAYPSGNHAQLHTPSRSPHFSKQNGVQAPDAHPQEPATHPGPGYTVAEYAADKGFTTEFLASVDVTDGKWAAAPAVSMKYLDVDGQVLTVKHRIAATGDKMRNARGKKVAMYGLNRLGAAKDAGYVVLPEGESCTQTLWMHGYPALGLPSATGWRDDRDLAYLDDISKVYVIVEPDSGGAAALEHWSRSELRDRIALVRMPDGIKDVSELYLADQERFAERFEQALQNATPWAEHEKVADELAADDAWSRCSDLARSPRILDRFAERIEQIGLAGEISAAQLVYLGITSRVFDRPASMAVKGVSSAGKSFTVETVLRFFPASAYYALTGMSERALAYLDEPLSHRFLVLYEAAGIGDEMASYLPRSLLSESRIRYVTVDKTDGNLVAREIELAGPTGLLTTSTRDLHPENETRLLTVGVTDTADQTRQVLASIADESRRPADLSEWVALQEWVAAAPARVTIPFATTLASLVPPVAVRLRRDFSQLLVLIRAHAVLHRASRLTDADGQIIASFDDYDVARGLVGDVISEGLGAGVSEATRETVDAVRVLVTEAISPEDGVRLKAIADKLELERSTVTRRVQVARRAGYLVNLEQRRGQPMRLVMGDPLPDAIEIFPKTERLAAAVGGVHIPGKGVHSADAQRFSILEPDSGGGVQVCNESAGTDAQRVFELVDELHDLLEKTRYKAVSRGDFNDLMVAYVEDNDPNGDQAAAIESLEAMIASIRSESQTLFDPPATDSVRGPE